jgi:RecA-family ATPase
MKTWLAIDLALEATRPGGGKWLGLFPVKESRVLYIDQERPRGETQRRFKGVMAAKGLTNDLIRDRFSMRIATTTRLDFHPSFEAFKRTLREKQPDIVLIDSFATFHNSDENSLPQMQRVMEAIKTLRNEFNCAIWFIDHENKGTFQAQREDEDPSAFRIKGSIAKTAAIELALTVRRYDTFSSTVYNTKNTMAARTVGSFTVRVQDLPNGGGIDVRGQQ